MKNLKKLFLISTLLTLSCAGFVLAMNNQNPKATNTQTTTHQQNFTTNNVEDNNDSEIEYFSFEDNDDIEPQPKKVTQSTSSTTSSSSSPSSTTTNNKEEKRGKKRDASVLDEIADSNKTLSETNKLLEELNQERLKRRKLQEQPAQATINTPQYTATSSSSSSSSSSSAPINKKDNKKEKEHVQDEQTTETDKTEEKTKICSVELDPAEDPLDSVIPDKSTGQKKEEQPTQLDLQKKEKQLSLANAFHENNLLKEIACVYNQVSVFIKENIELLIITLNDKESSNNPTICNSLFSKITNLWYITFELFNNENLRKFLDIKNPKIENSLLNLKNLIISLFEKLKQNEEIFSTKHGEKIRYICEQISKTVFGKSFIIQEKSTTTKSADDLDKFINKIKTKQQQIHTQKVQAHKDQIEEIKKRAAKKITNAIVAVNNLIGQKIFTTMSNISDSLINSFADLSTQLDKLYYEQEICVALAENDMNTNELLNKLKNKIIELISSANGQNSSMFVHIIKDKEKLNLLESICNHISQDSGNGEQIHFTVEADTTNDSLLAHLIQAQLNQQIKGYEQ